MFLSRINGVDKTDNSRGPGKEHECLLIMMDLDFN